MALHVCMVHLYVIVETAYLLQTYWPISMQRMMVLWLPLWLLSEVTHDLPEQPQWRPYHHMQCVQLLSIYSSLFYDYLNFDALKAKHPP